MDVNTRSSTSSSGRGDIPLLRAASEEDMSGVMEEDNSKSSDERVLRKSILYIVAQSFFCDCFLLTLVVPILPAYFKGTPFGGVVPVSACFAIKPLMQFAFNPISGAYVDAKGPHFPLFISQLILGVSTFILALAVGVGTSPAAAYALITSARAVQGYASSLVNAAGITLVVQTHSADVRGTATGIATAGIAAGVLAGPPLGGVLSSIGNFVPFACVGTIIIFGATLQAVWHRSEIFSPSSRNEDGARAFICRWRCVGGHLLRDIRVSALGVACLIANGLVGMAEPLFPLYLQNIHPNITKAHVGLIFGASTLSYLFFTPLGGFLSDAFVRGGKKRRWVTVVIGLVALAGSMVSFYASSNWVAIFVALVGIGIGMALVDAPSMAILADIIDEMSSEKDEALYGSAFALLDSCVSLGYAGGPLLGAAFEQASATSAASAFRTMTLIFACLCIALAPVVTYAFSRRGGKGRGGDDDDAVDETSDDGMAYTRI